MAFLVLLEGLTPIERAVFLLREVFDYGYRRDRHGGREERRELPADRGPGPPGGRGQEAAFEASRKRREELASRFFEAVINGDSAGLLELLAADVVVYADGGGKGPAFPRPVYGRDRAARVLLGARKGGERLGVVGMRPVWTNGQPGALFPDSEGRPIAVVTVDVADDRVQTVRAISNPEKLRRLGSFLERSGPRP
jgi:RNA polymerase sigma-70 factor (ECF subfamily)